jgi:hypothetical protein
MYFTHRRDSKKARKNHARVARKPKVRWEVLGLPRALGTRAPTSMEDIRRQVSHMAHSWIEQDPPKTRG